MLDKYLPENILFFDVETVPQVADYEMLETSIKLLWDKKSTTIKPEGKTPTENYHRAGIYAEFGKIVCISAGHIIKKNNERFFRVKSFYGDNEITILKEFGALLTSFCSKNTKNICGHNIKEFDVPYVARRMVINGVPLPPIFKIAGKKPWEVNIFDTMELWKFGDHKQNTSLELLATILGIPSPKGDIDGSKVAYVYYEEKDIERIVKYCEKDVFTTAQIFLKFRGEPVINEENFVKVR
ncbi:MAG: 3'-5' exonuclease [Marinilabiliaceae bacterium]|nr:3'-5' exonuclease [Marinilabiliaceae bacterium]